MVLGKQDFCCCHSVTNSHLILCEPMDCSTLGFPVLHHLSEFTQVHVHSVGDAIQPSHPLRSPFSSCPQSFSASGSFPMGWLFTSGGQSIEASAWASVFPVNIQDWFHLGLTVFLSEEAGFKKLILKYIQRWKPPVWGLSHRTSDEAFGELL